LGKFDIIILGPLPEKSNLREGMVQRVKSIDEIIFKDKKRLYIEVVFKTYRKPILEKIDDKLYHIKTNIINSFNIKDNLMNAKIIYIHSLYYLSRSFPWIFFSKANIFFDLHGVVPEELSYMGKYYQASLYRFFEFLFFNLRKRFNIIYVTQSMRDYIKKKYKIPGSVKEYIVPNFPFHLNKFNLNENQISLIKKKYYLEEDDIIFLYSGNAQKWQNVDLMLSLINKLANNRKNKFIILTGQPDIFKEKLKKYRINSGQLFLDSVPPEELGHYYFLAHYGFLLRDKHILNKVACPTKAIEYLAFGLTPIVLEENIGDFREMGYEYIKVDEVENFLFKPIKSLKNREIFILFKEKFENNLKDLKIAIENSL